jgi:hypoxia up-regulated 1
VGVDLGSQYFKAAIVSPGKPFDVVHNQHSKRKTPTVVSFHEKVRTFGDDALASAARGLPKTPMFFMHELGRNLTGISADDYSSLPKRFYPYSLDVNSSGSLQFRFGEEDGVTAEEATAHILGFVKRLAEEAADGNKISETVLTVPSHATFAQRHALLAAAEIARLADVQLIHETSAAALQRAPDLSFGVNGTANSSTVLFYNMGARHVEVCVVAYRAATHMSKPTAAMDVLGCALTGKTGGHHVDMVVAEEMRNAFGKKNPKLADGLGNSVRALKKLEKEANGMKHVLSANKEANFRVEALFEDTDFSQQVSRDTLESLCEPLLKEATVPIEAALKAANITLDDVDTVEMIGGAWRMPKVQSLLSEYLKSQRSENSLVLNLSQHLNGEEAMATGAAFFGANTSTSFRTKKIFFTDITPHSYALLIEPLNASQLNETEKGWLRGVELFPEFSKLRAKKTVKLHQSFDISMTLLENGNRVAIWELKGIHEAATTTYVNLSTPLISLKMDLDASGIVRLSSAQAIFDEPYTVTEVITPPPRVANSTMDGANSSSNATHNDTDGEASASASETQKDEDSQTKSDEQGETAKSPDAAGDADATEATDAAAANVSDSANSTVETVTKTKIRKLKVTLDLLQHYEGIVPRPLTSEEKQLARSKLDVMDEFDGEVRRTDAAKNALEAFIYESREKVSSDENCLQVSTEEEREDVASMLMQAEDWFYEDEAMNGNASVFEAKQQTLNEKVGAIKMRAFELEQRPLLPELVDKVRHGVNVTLEYVKTNMTWVAAKEIEGVQNLTESFETWYANVTEVQSNTALTEMPAYTVYDVKVRLYKIEQETQRLTKIKKIDYDYSRYGDGGYGGYGGYGGNGGYGGYNDPKMREYYRTMFENMSRNGTNGSDWWKGFGANTSNFSGWNDSEYMKSFYEHMARNAEKEQARGNSTGDAPDGQGPAPSDEGSKANHTEL